MELLAAREAGRTGRLPHPYGKAVLVAHGREMTKVTHGFFDEIGVARCEQLGRGSPSLSGAMRGYEVRSTAC